MDIISYLSLFVIKNLLKLKINYRFFIHINILFDCITQNLHTIHGINNV